MTIRSKRIQHRPVKKLLTALNLLLIITFIVYANTLFNKYNYDDNFVVLNKQVEKGISGIYEIFTSHYWEQKNNTFGYRPLSRAVFAIEMSLWGKNPALSHLVNILLYVCLILVSYKVLKKIFVGFPGWILTSVLFLFALHPVHTEVVASLKNREEILVFLFGFLSLFYFLIYYENRKIQYLAAGLLLFMVSCLTKENSIVFSAIIPLSLLFYDITRNKQLSLKKLFPHFSVAATLLVIGYFSLKLPEWILSSELKAPLFYENPLHFSVGLTAQIFTGIYLIYLYVKLLLFPHPLVFYYGYNMIEIQTAFSWQIILILAVIILVIYYGISATRKNPVLIFGLLFFLISLSVYLNFLFPVNGIFAERFVFIASMGFVLFAGGIINKTVLKSPPESRKYKVIQKRWLILITVICVVLSVATFNRNSHWRTYKSLLSHDISYLGNSAKAQSDYANLLLKELKDTIDKGYKPASEDIAYIDKYFLRSTEIDSGFYSSYNNIGLLKMQFSGEYAGSVKWFEKALKIKENYTEASYNLAYCYLTFLTDTQNAYKYFLMTYNNDSTHIHAASQLANLCFSRKKIAEAIMLNKKIIASDSDSDIPYINTGNYFLALKDTARAVLWWEKAIVKNPDNPGLSYGLSRYFMQNGDTVKSGYYNDIFRKYKE